MRAPGRPKLTRKKRLPLMTSMLVCDAQSNVTTWSLQHAISNSKLRRTTMTGIASTSISVPFHGWHAARVVNVTVHGHAQWRLASHVSRKRVTKHNNIKQ